MTRILSSDDFLSPARFGYIVLPVEFSSSLAGKNLYNNRLQSLSRKFYTLKGILVKNAEK